MILEKELKELRDKNDVVFKGWYAYAVKINSELEQNQALQERRQDNSIGQMHPVTQLRNITAAICLFHSLTISHKKCLQGNLYKLSNFRLFT